MTVIFDSSWPQLHVKSAEEAFEVADWQFAYDEGDVTAGEFIDLWGMNPDNDYMIVIGA
jgi:hypothetical protein